MANELPIETYPDVQHLLMLALEEDIGTGDATTLALVPQGAVTRAVIRAREPLVAAGIPLAEWIFKQLAADCDVRRCCMDGDPVAAGDVLLELSGNARAILSGERTALNILQHVCGIATLTARVVEHVAGTQTKILDTRKTTPGLRRLEKYAVACGGGTNHRFGLHDAMMIKDNHLAYAARFSLAEVVQRARKAYPELKLEIEVDSLEQLADALNGKPDWVLLDNMPPAMIREAVAMCRGICKTEASGGITLATVAEYAATGVDAISLGALTHSAPAVDIGMDFL